MTSVLALPPCRAARASDDGFDVAVIADRSGNHPDAGELATIEAVGVTWHLIQPFTAADATNYARKGPPT